MKPLHRDLFIAVVVSIVIFLTLGICLVFTGCEPQRIDQPGNLGRPNGLIAPAGNVDRFTVTEVMTVYDSIAYEHLCGVYVITDKKTGREYVGVSGIGISELGSHDSGDKDHNNVSDER